MNRDQELAALEGRIRQDLEQAHQAREVALAACRKTIRISSTSIRAIHRLEHERAATLADEAAAALNEAQTALAAHPQLAASGPLHDAEKEYAEARLTAALVEGSPLPSPDDLKVGAASWLGGLAEAASELRRHLLDRLRANETSRAEELLGVMSDVYDLLITIDYPDAVTGGLRRITDALRAVLERTRGDVTLTMLQARLATTIEQTLPPPTEAEGTTLGRNPGV